MLLCICLNQLSIRCTFTFKQNYTQQFESVTACHLSGSLPLGRSTEERIYLPVNVTFNRTRASVKGMYPCHFLIPKNMENLHSFSTFANETSISRRSSFA